MREGSSETSVDRPPAAPDVLAETAGGGAPTLERDLARARERLAFYEGFDRLIQENIARSGDLLRQAAEQREAAIRDVEQARAELDRRRGEQRATLTGLAEDLLGLQRRVGDLTGRVMAAIDDLGTTPPIAPPPLPAATAATAAPDVPLPPPAALLPVDAPAPAPPHEPPPVPDRAVAPAITPDQAPEVTDPTRVDSGATPSPAAAPVTDAPTLDPTTAQSDAPAATPPADMPPGAAPPAGAAAATVQPADAPIGAAPPTDAHVAGDAEADPEATRAVDVVVHGVPRAAAALALQRHLVGLPQVEAVEAREYAAGVLRLHVLTRVPLALADLRGWDGGGALEPVNLLPDVVEVRLPSTPGAQG